MAAPPSPPYPKSCGTEWYAVDVVTGHIPSQGTFGKQFQKGLSPLASKDDLKNIADDPQAQQDLQIIIEAKIDALREQVAENSGAGGARRFLTVKEEASVLWLLDHAEAELKAANKQWDTLSAKWENRKNGAWPLNYGDKLRDFHIACEFKKPGDTVTIPTQGRDLKIKCPSAADIKQRPKDRAKVVQRFEWALMSVRCAEWGLNRILLYKEALAELHDIELPKKTPPGKKPDFGGPSDFKAPSLSDNDMCKLLGIGCPPDMELPPPEGGTEPTCPDDFCIDTGSLPDPEDIDDGLEGEDAPKAPAKKPRTYSTGTVVTAGVIGAVAVYGLVTLLRPR